LLDFRGDGAADSAFDTGDKASPHPLKRVVGAELFNEREGEVSHGFLVDEHYAMGSGGSSEENSQESEAPGDRVAGLRLPAQ